MDVVVTLQTDNFSRDFSLPADIKLKELCPRLLNALQHTSAARFSDWKYVILKTNAGVLADSEATLLDYGICTGAYLYLAKEEHSNGI